MEPEIVVVMKYAKQTMRTFVFKSPDAHIKGLYIDKAAFVGTPPEAIRVAVQRVPVD